MNWYLKCLKQYADFSGRARRKEYWLFALFNFIIGFVIGFIDGALGTSIPVAGIGLIGLFATIYGLAVFIPGLAVAVRRLHDIGKSGWWYFIVLIPIVGFIILLVWFCTEGKHSTNAWGPDPKAAEV